MSWDIGLSSLQTQPETSAWVSNLLAFGLELTYTINRPGFWVFGLRLELHIGSPWSPACCLQISGHFSVYNYMSHFLIINLFTYICMYVFIYIYVCINIFMYIYTPRILGDCPAWSPYEAYSESYWGGKSCVSGKKDTMPSSAIDYKKKEISQISYM